MARGKATTTCFYDGGSRMWALFFGNGLVVARPKAGVEKITGKMTE